jgi:hypothetical protein
LHLEAKGEWVSRRMDLAVSKVVGEMLGTHIYIDFVALFYCIGRWGERERKIERYHSQNRRS